MNNINLNNKKLLPKLLKRLLTLIIAIVILIIIFKEGYIKIINKYRNDRIFALESEKYGKEVSNPVFKIGKIMTYSDANINDLSENQDLSRVNVTQFTDFAIYIDNLVKVKELTEENTVNKIYVNNIGITNVGDSGIKKFSSKSIDSLGKYIPISESSKEVEYDVIHKNIDKVNNSAIVKEQKSNPDYKINFTINIENNLGELFACDCILNIDLSLGEGQGIYSGYIMQIFDLSNGDYRFKKV